MNQKYELEVSEHITTYSIIGATDAVYATGRSVGKYGKKNSFHI